MPLTSNLQINIFDV
jgi:hypothetical protein